MSRFTPRAPGVQALLLLACAGALPGSLRGEPTSAAQGAALADRAAPPVAHVLDVPFVPQTPALCGGAALAMVFRYWGQRGVHAESFAHLVTASGLGIRTGDLTNAAREHGWNATALAGGASVVREHLTRGLPVIALIEDRPGRYHYVVLLAWNDDRVVLHDPARGPFRSLTEAAFERVWIPSGRWSLVVLPYDDGPPAVSASRTRTTDVTFAADTLADETAAAAGAIYPPGCAGAVQHAVDLAARGELPAAEAALIEASATCPANADVILELAGLRFLQGRYADAAAAARTVLHTEPDRAYGWELLASSLFLLDDRDGALDAWNRIERPRNDLVRIDGLQRTPFHVVYEAVAIPHGSVVSSDGLERARRRVAALPTVRRARVDYRPLSGGDVEVHAAIAERPMLSTSTTHLVAHALRAAVEARLLFDAAAPAGAGELWSLEWGWQPARRTIALGLAAPGAFGTTWIWELHAANRVRTFRGAGDTVAAQPASDAALRREERRSVVLRASDWTSATLRWQLAAGVDDWIGAASYATAGAALELHSTGQRAALRADVNAWLPTTGPFETFQTAHFRAAVRAAPGSSAFDWHVGAGLALAPPSAPRSIWSGAGSTVGADAPLRAHPLHDRDGVVLPDFLAPNLAHATVELRRWFRPAAPFTIAAAVFADAADARRQADRRATLDIGAGARVNLPGLDGMLRVDLARSTSAGATVLSAGWMSGWPAWW